jgi:hypothetical protein
MHHAQAFLICPTLPSVQADGHRCASSYFHYNGSRRTDPEAQQACQNIPYLIDMLEEILCGKATENTHGTTSLDLRRGRSFSFQTGGSRVVHTPGSYANLEDINSSQGTASTINDCIISMSILSDREDLPSGTRIPSPLIAYRYCAIFNSIRCYRRHCYFVPKSPPRITTHIPEQEGLPVSANPSYGVT